MQVAPRKTGGRLEPIRTPGSTSAEQIWQDTQKDQHSAASGRETPEFSSATCRQFHTDHMIIYSSSLLLALCPQLSLL